MTFEYALKKNKIKNVDINTSIDFAAMQGAFIGGIGDFVTLFEPNALSVEKEGYGYVVASVGLYAGTVPYTAFNARKSYIEKNKDTIRKFNKALQRGIDYVNNHKSSEIAKYLTNQFPDISLSDLEKIIDRYKKIDAWYKTTYINESDFKHLGKIINDDSLEINFKKLVNNNYSKK